MPPYILLSPVGDHRSKQLKEFIEAAKNFTPPPDKIVLCLDLDTKIDIKTIPDDVIIKYSPEISSHPSTLERICSAREILRNHFIYGKYDLALWIDSDIISPPELPSVLYDAMEKEQTLIVVNKYQGRGAVGEMWCGSGVMLTSKSACTASKFWVGNIYTPEGVEKHLSEDFVFFAIFDQGKHPLKIWTGRTGRSCEEYVKVKHYIEVREHC